MTTSNLKEGIFTRTNRLKEIEEYISSNESVSLDNLCETFKVSKNTIRRDINELVKQGGIKKVYGGVTLNERHLVPFEERNIINMDSKHRIAKKAAELVLEGDVIFLDSGTTTINMIPFLKDKHVSIVTNNLDAINDAIPFPNLNIISIGGMLIRNTKSFHGFTSGSEFMNFNVNKAFMAATGISIATGVTNSSPLEYDLKRSIVEKCADVYLLVDHTKFNVSSLLTYCKLADLNHLVTDLPLLQDYADFFGKSGTKIHLADNNEKSF